LIRSGDDRDAERESARGAAEATEVAEHKIDRPICRIVKAAKLLMLAWRCVIRPCSLNSQFSLP